MAKMHWSGLVFGQGTSGNLPAEDDVTPDVVILVESPEHGRRLQTELPDWQLLHDIPDPNSSDVLEDYYVPARGKAIVTASYGELYGISADVLVWAGGSAWPLTDDSFPRRSAGDGDTVLLIDLVDQHDARLRDGSKQRIRHYRDWGWHVRESIPQSSFDQ